MKLLTYKLPGEEKERLGVMSSSEFEKFFPLEELGLEFLDMNDLIARVKPEEMELMKKASCGLQDKTLNYKEVIHCAPIPHPHQDIICLGLNFMDHAEESTRYKKEVFQRERRYAVYFSKRVNEAIGDLSLIHI